MSPTESMRASAMIEIESHSISTPREDKKNTIKDRKVINFKPILYQTLKANIS